jgi:hypothetical protein
LGKALMELRVDMLRSLARIAVEACQR